MFYSFYVGFKIVDVAPAFMCAIFGRAAALYNYIACSLHTVMIVNELLECCEEMDDSQEDSSEENPATSDKDKMDTN